MRNEEEKTVQAAPEPTQAPVSKGKRTALIHYLTVLFAAAFILVLGSLLIQNGHNSELKTSNASAVAKAAELQTTNRSLQEQISQMRVDAAEQSVLHTQELTGEREDVQAVYDAVIYVLTQEPREGDVYFTRAMETVEEGWEKLTETAQEQYTQRLEEIEAAKEAPEQETSENSENKQ